MDTQNTESQEQIDYTPISASEDMHPWTSMIPMLLIFIIFYFLLIRPQEKKRRLQQDKLLTLKTGEEVVTNSGLFGIVKKINKNSDVVIIEIAKNVEIKILQNSIADIISRKINKG